MKQNVLETRGVRYRILSAGEGFPVLLLHGFTGNAEVWRKVMETVTTFHWVAPDLLGHGQTDSPRQTGRYSMQQQLEDLKDIMNQLGFPKFACVGYSMGGRVALALSVNYSKSVKALVLESSSPGLVSEVERQARVSRDEALATRIESVGVNQFVSEWEQIPLFATQNKLRDDTLQTQRDIRLRQTARGLANSLRGMGTGAQPSYWPRLREVQAPTLLVTGEDDRKFTDIAVEMTDIMHNSEHVGIPAAGHTVHLEEPTAFWNTVVGFLQSNCQ